jgi:hypothetical protein
MSPCFSILRKLAKKLKLTLQKSFITLSHRVLLLAAKFGELQLLFWVSVHKIKVLFTYLGYYYFKVLIKICDTETIQKWLVHIKAGLDNLKFLQHFSFIFKKNSCEPFRPYFGFQLLKKDSFFI